MADRGVSGGVAGFRSVPLSISSKQDEPSFWGDPDEPRRGIVITLGFVGL